MKTLYLDCGMGAAGDMLTAALLELLPDPDAFLAELNGLGIPGVTFSRESSEKCGVVGTHVTVTIDGEEEESHDCAGGAPHDHIHHGGSLQEVEHLLALHFPVSDTVRENALAVYRSIAEAESRVHGIPVTAVHFHEVGAKDAIADITAVCMLMERIAPDEVVVSPVHVGSGQVWCTHGILPVPAPATAQILRGVPIYGGRIKGELCTPTGAALLRHFAARFGDMPVMQVEKIGYGMGKKNFEAANCVRAMLGETTNQTDTVVELSCNVDDMTAEQMGFAMERLFDGGALDVYTTPVGMKKSRPGTLIRVMCREEDREAMVELMFKYTTTIGIREAKLQRYVLNRRTETAETCCGPVRRKVVNGYGTARYKYEYEDLARIARERGLNITDVMALLEKH